MSLIRWEPFGELMTLRRAMDRLFEESFVRPSKLFAWEDGLLPLDVYQTKDSVVVKASLPGVKPEEVEINLTDDVLTIKGETKEEQEIKDEEYLLQERRYGSFCRTVTLSGSLKTDKAEATFGHGVLTLTIPKKEEAKPREIKVKVAPALEGKKAK